MIKPLVLVNFEEYNQEPTFALLSPFLVPFPSPALLYSSLPSVSPCRENKLHSLKRNSKLMPFCSSKLGQTLASFLGFNSICSEEHSDQVHAIVWGHGVMV